MDKEHSPVLQELHNMQLKISHLFLDVMRELNEYKLNSKNVNKKLEELSNEAEFLKKQNKILKENNEEMKSVIEKGISVFKNLDFSNLYSFKEHKIELETLKILFFEFSKKLETFATGRIMIQEKEKNLEIDNIRCKLSDEEIKKQFEGLSNLNFFTNFSYEKAVDENSQITNSCSNTALRSLFQNVSVIRNTREPLSEYENSNFDSKSLFTVKDEEIHKISPTSREIETRLDRSPVFKDIGIRKLDNLSSEDCGSSSSTSLSSVLINEKFLEKAHNFVISPQDESPHHKANEKTPSKKSSGSKRTRNKLNINTPEKSPRVMLKKSNMREAEISFSGIRKFRQTLLNIDCYKKDNSKDFENSENRKDENSVACIDNKKNEKVKIVDDEDDDFITESPNKADQILEDIKIKKSEPNLNKVPFITPPQTSDLDFDETYISSSLLRKCNATNKRELEIVIQDQTPLKRHSREISPEYDSMPFAYKREPVRKRAERMKLPGHACLECMKYYEKEFGDLGTQGLKKILNKCSRHRDKNSPTNDDTPPGYWKPYITCSSIMSPDKDNVSEAVIN